MERNSSEKLYKRACEVMVGGVNSPVRSFIYVGGKPIFIRGGSGCFIEDVDGNKYIDYVLSYGALIHGHANKKILARVREVMEKGTTFGAPTEDELLLAEEICRSFPSIEKVRLVNSGTEATMSAIRLAKAYTKKKFIVKFDGCYHGHVDQLLVKAGSGVATLGIPSSQGVDFEIASKTISARYNDINQIYTVFSSHPNDIAAVIIEPVAGNMGVVPAEREFLKTIKELCDKHNSVLIFDEVITGFRVSRGGAQELYKIKPDMTCLGKVIGGGFPIGAFGGRDDIMNMLAPKGPVYQAGTLSGNPVACAAGLETLSLLKEEQYRLMETISSEFVTGVLKEAEYSNLPLTINRVGSMFSFFFTSQPVKNFEDLQMSNKDKFVQFHRLMLERGVYLPPSPYESCFLSTAHTKHSVQKTLTAVSDAFRLISK